MEFRESLHTSAPIGRAFDFVVDFANMERWDPGVESSRRVTPGAIGPGAEFELLIRFAGMRIPYRYRIVEYSPPHRAVLAGESKRSRATDTVSFDEAPGGTRIEWTGAVELRGPARVLGSVLFRPIFETAGRKALAGLKSALDASATI